MTLLLLSLMLFQQEDPKQLQAVVETSAGSFIMEFYSDQAPNHVQKFIELARQGFYNGTTFHSMVAHGIVQAGDPESKNPQARAKYGTGGFNLGLKPEISNVPFKQGTTAATILTGEPNTAGSQFFIAVTDQLQFIGRSTPSATLAEGFK